MRLRELVGSKETKMDATQVGFHDGKGEGSCSWSVRTNSMEDCPQVEGLLVTYYGQVLYHTRMPRSKLFASCRLTRER